jgi:hypothetical protein
VAIRAGIESGEASVRGRGELCVTVNIAGAARAGRTSRDDSHR